MLQTAAHPYITILGPRERAAQRFSIMGICNKGAGILAPLVFAAVVLRSSDGELFMRIGHMGAAEKAAVLDGLIRRVIGPYSCLGVVLLGLAALTLYSTLPEIGNEEKADGPISLFSSWYYWGLPIRWFGQAYGHWHCKSWGNLQNLAVR